MCFIIEVIIADKNFQPILFSLLIIFKDQLSSEYVSKEEFMPKYA